jgi:hypothetical protein
MAFAASDQNGESLRLLVREDEHDGLAVMAVLA